MTNSPKSFYSRLIHDKYPRAYHNWNHITEGLKLIPKFKLSAEEYLILTHSWIYHDVFYEPGYSDNEERSACMAINALGDYFPMHFTDQVQRCIIATKHDKLPSGGLEQIICDIDLYGFSQPYSIYRNGNYFNAGYFDCSVESTPFVSFFSP